MSSEASMAGQLALDHYTLWGDIMEDTDYRGRFDIKRKLVSVINPFEGRPIPNIILRRLYEEFGNDIKIVEFE